MIQPQFSDLSWSPLTQPGSTSTKPDEVLRLERQLENYRHVVEQQENLIEVRSHWSVMHISSDRLGFHDTWLTTTSTKKKAPQFIKFMWHVSANQNSWTDYRLSQSGAWQTWLSRAFPQEFEFWLAGEPGSGSLGIFCFRSTRASGEGVCLSVKEVENFQ